MNASTRRVTVRVRVSIRVRERVALRVWVRVRVSDSVYAVWCKNREDPMVIHAVQENCQPSPQTFVRSIAFDASYVAEIDHCLAHILP